MKIRSGVGRSDRAFHRSSTFRSCGPYRTSDSSGRGFPWAQAVSAAADETTIKKGAIHGPARWRGIVGRLPGAGSRVADHSRDTREPTTGQGSGVVPLGHDKTRGRSESPVAPPKLTTPGQLKANALR